MEPPASTCGGPSAATAPWGTADPSAREVSRGVRVGETGTPVYESLNTRGEDTVSGGFKTAVRLSSLGWNTVGFSHHPSLVVNALYLFVLLCL